MDSLIINFKNSSHRYIDIKLSMYISLDIRKSDVLRSLLDHEDELDSVSSKENVLVL